MMIPVDTTGQNNDASLMMQIAQGNGHAFNLLFRKYWEYAFSSAYKRLKDEDQAKDIVQDIFAHIWINKATLHINNIPAYLNRAVRNKVLKAVVQQKKAHPFIEVLENITRKELGADAPMLRKEFYKAYENLIDTMPPQRRTIFRLRFDDNLPTKDIASSLGLSTKTVQNQLGKAFEKLRMSLAHLWIFILLVQLHFA